MSRRWIATAAVALAAGAGLLRPGVARACGAFFASEVSVDPDQKIVVAFREGIETYVFRPHFCGAARDFGVILPIPSSLRQAPSLADNALFDQLDALTAPEVEEVCESSGFGCGMKTGAAGVDGVGAPRSDVDVINRGRVGEFEYAELRASSASAFTDWLDQNGFPHDAGSSDAFASYVAKSWYFVAFKVSADASAPPAGKKLCGDLGPIQLSFEAARPTIPARIAAVNSAQGPSPLWRVFAIAAQQQQLASQRPFSSSLYFAGSLRLADLEAAPAIAALSREGERLTVLSLRFPVASELADIELEANPQPADYRSRRQVSKNCNLGCATGGVFPSEVVGAAAILGLLLARRRQRV